MPRAWVMVLGDVGRSPRMQYHASSLCKTVRLCADGQSHSSLLPPSLPPEQAKPLQPAVSFRSPSSRVTSMQPFRATYRPFCSLATR